MIKNEIATDNSIKLIETSLTEIGVEASTQTGGLTLRELEGLDRELRTISGSLRSAITKSLAKQVDIDKEKRKLKEMANDETLTEIGVEASTQTGGLTLRELEGLDRELRTISGSLRSAITKSMAKQVDIDKEKRKLEEMANDETYSDQQREEVRARLQRFQDEQKAINDQIRILTGRYSNQIYQIRESIEMKFLDKETGTLGERIRTLFKEQGVMIVSILTALGITIGVLIEALLGSPTVSTTTSQSTTTSDKKGVAREWTKNKLKALSQLLGN